MKGFIFEVQKFGVTLEFDKRYKSAESAFKVASPGGVVFMKLDRATGVKRVIGRR